MIKIVFYAVCTVAIIGVSFGSLSAETQSSQATSHEQFQPACSPRRKLQTQREHLQAQRSMLLGQLPKGHGHAEGDLPPRRLKKSRRGLGEVRAVDIRPDHPACRIGRKTTALVTIVASGSFLAASLKRRNMKDQNLQTGTRRFAVGVFMALAVVAVTAFAAPGAVEAGGLNAAQPQQFAELSPGALLRQCKARCVSEYNSCVAGGCSPGRGPDGKCTHAEAVAGCTVKHGARKDRCLANCDQ